MLGNAATTVKGIRAGLEKYGPSQGGKKMLVLEEEAANEALRTGLYVVWRSKKLRGSDFCSRVGPGSKCFCGHLYTHHKPAGKRARPKCQKCPCSYFNFIPQRPEEVGDWWLTRRKGFNVNTWRAKCRCGHPHDAHDPSYMSCKQCGCSQFQSNFLCINCDGHFEEHETVFENEMERKQAGRPVGHAFRPFTDKPGIRSAVFEGGNASTPAITGPTPEELYSGGLIDASEYHRMLDNLKVAESANDHQLALRQSGSTAMARVPVRKARLNRKFDPKKQKPERSVRLMHVSSGGTRTGRVVNRWGKVSSNNNKK